jgi:hypothetical protein
MLLKRVSKGSEVGYTTNGGIWGVYGGAVMSREVPEGLDSQYEMCGS